MALGAYGAAGAAAYGASSNGRSDLRTDPFLSGAAGGAPSQVARAAGAGGAAGGKYAELLEISIKKAEGLPPQAKHAAKTYPICVCQIKSKPTSRLQTGPCSNLSYSDPVWGQGPEHFRAHLEGWAPGDTLTFSIQEEDAASSKVIGMKELTYKEYQNGFEWWLPLQVAKMKRYPEGWPYAALQIRVQLVQGVLLTPQDPFMSEAQVLKPKSRGCCSFCLPCRMWCARRSRICCLCSWINCKWMCIMSCLGCWLGCLECRTLWSMIWSWCLGRNSLNDLRRDCSKRFKLPDADDDDDPGDTACCCIPLRTAVFAISVVSTINAIIAFFFSEVQGGYSIPSRVIVGATQVTGIIFGPIGAIGAYELNVSLLQGYNLYQFVRLCGMFFMLYTDIPLLYDCNQWRVDLNGAIKENGWNPAMYNVAMGNNCLQAQINFACQIIFSLVIYVYLISLTRRLIWDTEATPRYLLAMPRETPNGAFVKHDRTHGKSKPPYGSVLGNAGVPLGPKGLLEYNQQPPGQSGLVGPPVMMAPGSMPPGVNGARPGMMGGPGMQSAAPGFKY